MSATARDAATPDAGTPDAGTGYRSVPAQVDLPRLEHDVLQLWRDRGTFRKSIEQSAGRPDWTFYEGPPTANGTPGVHHVEARVFKDLYCRFKTMQGFSVGRKAGWDCQGLHVEVGVEKELGLSGKAQIEAFGIAEFNQRCRESVVRSTGEFEELTERMGYWIDLDNAYRTMDPGYIESVWWSLKQVFDKGLLYPAHRVTPYCPRCETALSDHELGQPDGYETIVDPSVFVRFPLTSGPLAGEAALLVWTTTPWTLVSNTAVAVHPGVTYVTATDGTETLVVAEPLFETVLGEGWQVTARFDGRDLERWTYRRPLDLLEFPAEVPAHYVVLAEYVTTTDGSGLVHQAPAFGGDDMAVAREYGLPVLNPVRPDGHFVDDLPLVGGIFFKEADPSLVRQLRESGSLFRSNDYQHSYPHCWRCHTPLLYYAMAAWYIRTTAVKDELLAENERTNWNPDTVKWGRYGDWLNNNVDWSLSRTRYWGTPLPIWRNTEDPENVVCVGSLAELGELAGQDLSALDPHRPFVDDVTFTLPGVEGEFRRVSEVIDAWYDSGSMPFAQWGYPYADGSEAQLQKAYPAQFICEALDQTRGWFYSLMAIGTLVFGRSSYENVLCLGLLLSEDGRKMSKHLGNILLPLPVMDEYGADALRWFMACTGSPWADRRVGPATLTETVRKVLLTYWNTVAFHTLYARAAGWTPGPGLPPDQRHVLDRWLVSKRESLTRKVTDALEDFDTQTAGALLATFIDDMSNWYVRRSRRRFWDGDVSALTTLHETLDTLTRLLAPLTPFVTEQVWQDVVVSTDADAPTSVHLASWPMATDSSTDAALDAGMHLVRRLTELGRSARAEAKVKTRQPLQRILVPTSVLSRLTPELVSELTSELNITAVEAFGSAGDLVDHSAKANFRSLGRRYGRQTPQVAAAVAAADATALATTFAAGGTATLEVDGLDAPVELAADDVLITERPREGWSVVNEHGETVALDLTLTPALVRAGLAREVVRTVQEARKAAGLEVTDRVAITWSAGPAVAEAIREHAGMIADEVLAVELTPGQVGPDGVADAELGLRFELRKSG